MSKFTKDDEFKILLSMEDIDKIDEEIKNIDSNSKKIDESNMIESEEAKLTEDGENYNVVDGVILLNTCMTCHNKFKPLNSMIYETSCNACSEKK